MTPRREAVLADAEERAEVRTNLDDTLFVEAAAGTGKTTALVGRIVEVLRTGRGELENLVAVTFTEKAAGEMKLRLRAEIEAARAASAPRSEAREHLTRALQQLELAHIGTIHGFCADLLRERPVEAGVDPVFHVAAEDEAGRLLDRAFEGWFQTALADPPPGVRRALRRNYARNSGGPRAALRGAVQKLSDHRDFAAAWTRPRYEREASLDRAVTLVRELGALAPHARRADDYLARNLANIATWVRELDAREKVRGRDYDYVEANLRTLLRARWIGWHWRGFAEAEFGAGLTNADVRERREAARLELADILALADADMAALLREELRPVIEAYEALKRRAGRLDFVDLLLRTRDLLRDDPGIRRHYRRRFTHFFVDEFQDTDPLQVEILLLLSAREPAPAEESASSGASGEPPRWVPERGKLFVVGDPKQSIYRFRRADVMLYERTKRELAAADARILQLTTSFRSQPRIQRAVNGAFARRMSGSPDGSQAAYVPLAEHRSDLEGQPAVIALPVPRPYGRFGTVYKNAIEDSLPDAVGAFVQWLVAESGWKVTERERPGTPVAVEPRHVCLLFRRFQSAGRDITRPYVRALEAREIPHVLVGGRSYFDREEVLAVRNALTAIEWPDDRLSVYAALRGPLFSLGDGALFRFGAEVGPLHPLSHTPAGDPLAPELGAVAEALRILGDLHRERNRRPVPETILRLLAAVRAHAGVAIWPTGEQALANVLRLVDRARAFERTGAPSFRAFLDRMEEEAARGQAEEAPIVEEGTEGVRMMTVHKAKGLEFPVVILADMTCNATFETPSRHVDTSRGLWAEPLCGAAPLDLLDHVEIERVRDRAESDRLAYVAATRARDLLVVPALADGRDGEGGVSGLEPGDAAPAPAASDDAGTEWWLDALNPAIYPAPGQRRSPRPVGGLACPAFGDQGVLERSNRRGEPRATPTESVAPGLHRALTGSDVLWWDPHVLALDVDPPTGRRQDQLLEVDAQAQPTLSVEEGIARHERWREARAERLAAGRAPEFRLAAARGLAEAAAAAGTALPMEDAVEWVDVPRLEEGREAIGGERFGRLVHEALAVVPLVADEAAVGRAVRAQARRLGASADETTVAAALVARALAHPVLRAAAAAGAVDPGHIRREVPLLWREPDGTVVEGVADLAYRESDGRDGGGRWVVVDYKTDRDVSLARDAYRAQVALYVAALHRATGEPARGVVLAF